MKEARDLYLETRRHKSSRAQLHPRDAQFASFVHRLDGMSVGIAALRVKQELQRLLETARGFDRHERN